MTERQHYPVAVSLEAVAAAWVRQGNAKAGSMVQLSNEVAPRLRDASVWEPRAGVRAAVVARPSLRVEQEPLCWVAAVTAGALACDGVSTWWPDRLLANDGADVGAMNVVTIVSHGRIDAVVVAGRWDLAETDVERFAAEVIRLLDLVVEDPGALLAAHAAHTALFGRRVRATLLPRGELRGVATAIETEGTLLLTSPTGLTQRLAVDQLRTITPI